MRLISAVRLAVAVSCLLVVPLAGGLEAGVSSPASPHASKIVDRKFVCSTIPQGGARKINVFAQAGVRVFGDRSKWKSLAQTWVLTGSIYESPFIGIGAGAPAPQDGYSALFVKREQCGSSGAKNPLTPVGLEGGLASQLGDEYECPAPREVLVRVRALFRTPTELHSKPFGHIGTNAVSREASFVVRTPSGKPIAYTTVSESGRARLFTARSCLPE